MTPADLRKLLAGYHANLRMLNSPDEDERHLASIYHDREKLAAADAILPLAPALLDAWEALEWADTSIDTLLAGKPHRTIPELRAAIGDALARLRGEETG